MLHKVPDFPGFTVETPYEAMILILVEVHQQGVREGRGDVTRCWFEPGNAATHAIKQLSRYRFEIVAKEEEPSGYAKAVSLIMGGFPSATSVAEALGDDPPDGEQGNVWRLYDARYATTRRAG